MADEAKFEVPQLQKCSEQLGLCGQGGGIGGTTFADINEIGCWLSFVNPDGVKEVCERFSFGNPVKVSESVQKLEALVAHGLTDDGLELGKDDKAAMTLLQDQLRKLTDNKKKLAGLVKTLQGYGMACYLGDALPAFPSNLYCTNDKKKLYAAIDSTKERTGFDSREVAECYANNTSRKTNPADLLLEFGNEGEEGELLGLSLKASYTGSCAPTICNLGMIMSDIKTVGKGNAVTLWDVRPSKAAIAAQQRIIDSRMDAKWDSLTDEGGGTYTKGKKIYIRPKEASDEEVVAAEAEKRKLLIGVTTTIVKGMVNNSKDFKWAGGSPTGSKENGYMGLLRMILHCQPKNLDYIFMSAAKSDYHGINFKKFKENLADVARITLKAGEPSGEDVISTPIHFTLTFNAGAGAGAGERQEEFIFIIRAKREGSFGPYGDSIKVNINIAPSTVEMLTKNYPIEGSEEKQGGGMKPKVGGMKLRSGTVYGWEPEVARVQINAGMKELKPLTEGTCAEKKKPTTDEEAADQILATEKNEMEAAEDEESNMTEEDIAERDREAGVEAKLQGGGQRRKMRKKTRKRKRSFTRRKKTHRRRGRRKNRKKTKKRRKKRKRRRTQYK